MSGQPADISALIRNATGLAGGNRETIFCTKLERIAGAAATTYTAGAYYLSSWLYDGTIGAGAAPGTTPRVPTNATAGGMMQANPGSGRQRYMTYADAMFSISNGPLGAMFLADRLADVSGASGTSTSLVSPSGGLVPTRYTDGYGVEIWVEIYTLIGATAQTLTVNYTDPLGASKSTTVTIGGAGLKAPGAMIRVPWATGGLGCASVQSFQLGASTGTAGDFGITLLYPLVFIPLPNFGTPTEANLLDSPVEVVSGACLFSVIRSSSTTVSRLDTTVVLMDGPT